MITAVNLLFTFGILTYAFAQLADGHYTFSNSNYILTFTIESGGWDIQNTTLTNKSSGQVEKQTGSQFMIHPPSVWYQFQTPFCNYSFEAPNKKLKLEKFDCKNVKKYKEENIILKKN